MASREQRYMEQIRALELRRAGASLDVIAEELGVSRMTAHRRLQRAIQDLGAETSDQIRATQENRLDEILSRAMAIVRAERRTYDADGVPVSGEYDLRDQLAAMKIVLQVERDRTKLLGTYVPPVIVLQHEGVLQ